MLAEVRADLESHLRDAKGPGGESFDFSKPVPNIDRSISEVEGRVALVAGLISSIDASADTTLLPSAAIGDIHSGVDQLINHYRTVREQLANIGRNGGVGSLDTNTFVLRSKNTQAALKLSGNLQQAWNFADSLLSAYYRIAPVLKGGGHGDFSGVTRSFNDLKSHVESIRVHMDGLANESRTDRKQIDDLRKRATSLHEEVSRLRVEAEDRKSLTEYAAEGTTKIADIRKVHEQVEALRVTAEKYRARLTYSRQLSIRENWICKQVQPS